MAKISIELKELQRVLNRVSPLEGTCIAIGHLRYLVSFDKLLDPEPLVKILQQEESDETTYIASLQETFSLKTPPQEINNKWLALLQRELRRLESPGLLEIIQSNPKIFKGRLLDARGLSRMRQNFDAICAQPSGKGSVSALLSSMLGEELASWVASTCAALTEEYAAQPQQAALRVELLAMRVAGRPNIFEEAQQKAPIEEYAKQSIEAHSLPGRARKKKLWQIVSSLYAWPHEHKEHNEETRQRPLSAQLFDAIREIGVALRRQPRRRGLQEYKERTESALACYTLLFPPKGDLQLTQEILSTLQKKWSTVKRAFIRRALSLEQVIRILSLNIKEKKNYPNEERRLQSIEAWLEDGLPLEDLEAVEQRGLLPELLEQGWDTSVARSYCRWALRLAPHYEQQGIKLALSTKTFSHLQHAKNEELALLAQCLLEQDASDAKRAAQNQIATLDATLSLFQKIPQSFRDCLKGLDEIPEGLAEKHFPAFSAWLKETSTLNKFIYYCSLLGEPPTLSNALLEDFSRVERRQTERAYLASLANPSDLQKQMLAKLSTEEAPSDPARTLRRIEERCNEMLRRIYQARLDSIIAQSFFRAYGLSLPKITPAWRDIFRFYLNLEENQQLLGLLLQKTTAQPGQYFAPSLPLNQKWLEEAKNHFDTQVWISPRRTRATLSNDAEVVIELEEDPIEVLRMGVPFDTCLSLEEGSNAPSTVLNALDVNKRVIYARSNGEIVARQLIAISANYQLLCYRLYSSLEKSVFDSLQSSVNAFIGSLTQEAKLSRVGHGKPAIIHDGFWYDDGVMPAGEGSASPTLSAYCKELSLPIPKSITDSLYREAALWSALQEDRLEDVINLVPSWQASYLEKRASTWIYQKLGVAECIRRALPDDYKFFRILFQNTLPLGSRALFHCLRQIPPTEEAGEPLYEVIREGDFPSEDLIALAAEANRLASRSRRMNDHGIEHGLAYEIPSHISRLSVRQIFDLCDQAEPLWDWVVSQQSDCDVCIETATVKIVEESVRSYLKDPTQKEVISCLGDKRRSALARRVALRITSLFPMHKREKKSFHALNWFERGVADEVSIRNTLREMARDPRFATRSDLLAAMLRQGATQEEIDALPLCEKQPTRALDNLLMLLPWLGAWIQKKYPMPKSEPNSWYPRLWDYYFHRRFITPWRKALRLAAEENEKERASLVQHLSLIGDLDNIARLTKGRESHATENIKKKIERIHWQLDLNKFPEAEEDWNDVQRDEIDASLVCAALQYLSSLAPNNLGNEEKLTRALSVIFSAEIPNWIKLGVIERFTQTGIPKPILVALREGEVHEQRLYHEMPPALILRLWGESSLRSFIALDLGRMFGNGPARRYLQKIKRIAATEKIDLSSFISAWMIALNTNHCLEDMHLGNDKETLQEIARILVEDDVVDVWVRLYGELPDACAASWFLQVLEQQPSLSIKKIEAALQRSDGTSWDDRTMRYEWLQDLIRRRAS
jgi:hypothetical protein